MKTALDMKLISQENSTLSISEVEEIYKKIEEAAKKGLFSIVVEIAHVPIPVIISKLETLGYNVSEDSKIIAIDWS